jgi:hypothetical protein
VGAISLMLKRRIETNSMIGRQRLGSPVQR